MKTFLAVYVGSPSAMAKWEKLPKAEQDDRMTRGIGAWKAWAQRHESSIVDMGGPLGRTKQVTAAGLADIRNAMTGYTLVKAESQKAAARLFLEHPHFTIFPGEGVEVMEVLPIPG